MKAPLVGLQVLTITTTLFGFGVCAAFSGTRGLDELPVPVQSYVLREAVESGVEDIRTIRTNPDYTANFEFPDVKNSDLNSDGKKDYAVALCMFADSTPEFRTNGYPCAFGNLIISNEYGHSFVPTSGLVVRATASQPPTVVIRERQFNGECDDYVCDFKYSVKQREDQQGFELLQIKVCMPDKC